jgi:hypothetical protein
MRIALMTVSAHAQLHQPAGAGVVAMMMVLRGAEHVLKA